MEEPSEKDGTRVPVKLTERDYIAMVEAVSLGVSMTEVAKKWGVTKAMVSKQCRMRR